MSKKFWIISAAVLTVVTGAGAGVFIFSRRNVVQNTNKPSAGFNLLQTPQNQDQTSTVYQDASGYSFSYPSSITLKDTTPDDDTYYSQIELSKSAQSLTITITTGNSNPYKKETLLGSASMDGISTNQYAVNGRLISVAIDQGVLYVIDGPKDAGFWEDIQNKILTSFKFGTAETDTAATDQNTTYEEEVVQ